MGNSNLAGGLDAIQNAIGMFMGLRQKRIDNEFRETEHADQVSRANRQLDLQQRGIDLDEQAQHDRVMDQDRDNAQFLATNYPGMRVPAGSPTENLFKRTGIGGVLSPEQTLPSRQSPGLNDPLGIVSGGPATYSAPQPTGDSVITPNSTEKSRIALMTLSNRTGIANLNNQTDLAIESIRSKDRATALKQSGAFRQASLALQAQGQAISEDRLALAYAQANAQLSEDQFNMKLNAERARFSDPTYLMRMLMGGQDGPFGEASALPAVPAPQYFAPPPRRSGGGPAAPAGGGGGWSGGRIQ